MPQPDNDEGRPLAGPASSVIVADGDTPIVVRCICCGRELRAARSVRREIGPVCLAELTRAAIERTAPRGAA